MREHDTDLSNFNRCLASDHYMKWIPFELREADYICHVWARVLQRHLANKKFTISKTVFVQILFDFKIVNKRTVDLIA